MAELTDGLLTLITGTLSVVFQSVSSAPNKLLSLSKYSVNIL